MNNEVGPSLLDWAPSIVGGVVLFLIGIVLIVITVKETEKGSLKAFQLLTCASAIGLPISGVLLYVTYETEVLGGIFFFLTFLGCPLGLLVGGIGTLVVRIKQGRIGGLAYWIVGLLLLFFGVGMRIMVKIAVLSTMSWAFITLAVAVIVIGFVRFLRGKQTIT